MTDTPRYCSACGEQLSPGDSFCAACGERVASGERDDNTHSSVADEFRTTAADRIVDDSGYREPAEDRFSPTGGGATTDDDRQWLRQRVADLRARGWKVTRNDGDRVELVDRGIGSIPAHIAIFLFTSGLGNLLYGWYSWTWGAPERTVTADGHEEVDEGGSGLSTLIAAVAALALLGVNSMVVAIAMLFGAPEVAVSGLLFTLMMIVGAVAFRGDVDTASLSTFGRERRVESERVRTPPESCASCGDRVIKGERREFTDRFYLAGVPLRTYEEGTNTYCRNCVADSRDPDDVDDLERELERLRTEDDDPPNRGEREENRY